MNYVTLDDQGFATESGLIKYYTIDSDNIFLNEVEDFISIGTGLPARAYIDEPPEYKPGFAIVRATTGWDYMEDHRGSTVYDKTTGSTLLITKVGPVPEGYSFDKPQPDKIKEYTDELKHLADVFTQDVNLLSTSYAKAALIDGPNEQSKKLDIYTEYQNRKQKYNLEIQSLKLKYEV